MINTSYFKASNSQKIFEILLCFITNPSINTAYTASLNNNIGAFHVVISCQFFFSVPFDRKKGQLIFYAIEEEEVKNVHKNEPFLQHTYFSQIFHHHFLPSKEFHYHLMSSQSPTRLGISCPTKQVVFDFSKVNSSNPQSPSLL